MIPTAFAYAAPTSLDQALALLSQHGEHAKLLAGGQSLLPALKLRLAAVEQLIDLGRIPDLAYIREETGSLCIGARTTHYEVETSLLLQQRCPLLSECAGQIGDVQVRNRGTLGGSLAHADPAADYPAAILALDAEIRVVSAQGERSLSAEDFFIDMMTTALQPQEVLTEVRVPVCAAQTGSTYLKVRQPASGFAIVGIAAVVTLDGAGQCSDVRVGITGAALKAYRARETEALLMDKMPDEDSIAQAAVHATHNIETNDDLFASADYRAHLTRVYTKRALLKAVERARELA